VTVRDLVAHLGNVHAWATQIVRTNDPDLDDVEPGGDLSVWYSERAASLCAALAEVDPERPTWNFAGRPEVASFWVRRQLHEATMHTVDLDLACGAVPWVDPAIAEDGVLETFEVFGPRMVQRGHLPRLDGPVAFTATDTGTTWTLVPVPDAAPRVADAAESVAVGALVEGTAQDLFTTLWKRTDATVLTLADDQEVATRYLTSRLSP
jgi:uncharacterized protein (TIGR03083 family)